MRRSVSALRLTLLLCVLALFAIPSLSCTPISVAGALTGTDTVIPAYTGLKGKTVAIMAWADEGTRYEHAMLVLDVTRGVISKFQGAAKNGATELAGVTFPRSAGPEAIARFQADHPELAADSVTEIAPRLGVDRLIYIELSDMNLHSGAVADLYRGSLSATVDVVEVSGGKGKNAFHATIDSVFPAQSAEEGDPNLTAEQTYLGTLNEFCVAVVKKFVPYAAK